MTVFQPLEKSGGRSSNAWKPYPAYKPSGVEWLGDVPEEWEVKRGRFVMRVNPPSPRLRTLKPNEELTFVPMEAIGVQGGLNLDETRVLADVTGSYTEFQDGDVVVAKITPCFENGKAALASGLLNGAAYGTTELHVLRAGSTLDRSFLFYVAISTVFRKLGEAEMYGAGGQKRVPPEFSKNFRVPVPPLLEQRAIADFLDRETGKIDRLVEKKRELIERLKEERAALISRAVTRGLNPDAKLKPSGVEWLGDVPEGWEVKPISRIAETIQTGPFGSQLHTSDYVEGGIPLINPAHIVGGRLVPDDTSCVEEATVLRLHRHRLCTGDIVMGRRGEIGRCGVVTATENSWLCGTGSLVIRLRDCDSRYFSTVFSGYGFSGVLELRAVGTTMLNLSPAIVGRMIVPVPPLPEQRAIAEFLDRETGKIDRLMEKVEAAIERLREYRAALVTAAVTGKMDVRGEAGANEVVEYPIPVATYARVAEDAIQYGAGKRKGAGGRDEVESKKRKR